MPEPTLPSQGGQSGEPWHYPRRRLLHTGPRELFQHAFVEQIIVRFELIHLQKLGERDDIARVLVRVQVARLPQGAERVNDNLTRARKPLLEVFDGRLLLLLGADDHLTRNLIIKVREPKQQKSLSRSGRQHNMTRAFRIQRTVLQSLPYPVQHIALLDDVITTGSTLNQLAKQLRSSGVERVDGWALARAAKRNVAMPSSPI